MLHVITNGEMKRIEGLAIGALGIPSEVLMETASRAVAEELCAAYGRGRTAMFICGPGSNGGDGFCAARWHMQLGGKAVVVALGGGHTGAAALNRSILAKMGVKIYSYIPEGSGAEVLVDAMFGTGFHGELAGDYLAAARWMNASALPVIAVDIPSGVDGDTGAAVEAVRADATVTFQHPKLGHYLFPGRELAGRLVIADIGIPPAIRIQPSAHVLERADVLGGMIRPRRANTHKGTYGHVAIVAGSRGMAGAAVLAAQGALRGGAGLVTVGCCERTVLPVVQTGAFEAMAWPLAETESGVISPKNDFSQFLRGKTVLAFGSGMSACEDSAGVVDRLVKTPLPKVMDADALNVCNGVFGEDTVITPHPGEMARLTGRSAAEISACAFAEARSFAMERGVVVLLKGATTVIASPDGDVTLNITGTPAMSTGGSGDVLTGLIAALRAQGLSAYDSARAGAYLHGVAGAIAEQRLGTQPVTSMEIAANLHAAFK